MLYKTNSVFYMKDLFWNYVSIAREFIYNAMEALLLICMVLCFVLFVLGCMYLASNFLNKEYDVLWYVVVGVTMFTYLLRRIYKDN